MKVETDKNIPMGRVELKEKNKQGIERGITKIGK